MRRSHTYGANPATSSIQGGENHIEGENDQLTEEIKDKIHSLKNISIEIGNEVRYQNQMLGEMDDRFDKSEGFLGKSMSKVKSLAKKNPKFVPLYLFLFALLIFLFLWWIIK